MKQVILMENKCDWCGKESKSMGLVESKEGDRYMCSKCQIEALKTYSPIDDKIEPAKLPDEK